MDFYHCRVVLFTHCKDTFICKHHVKVNFASNAYLKKIFIQVMKDFESVTDFSVEHYFEVNPAWFTCFKMINSSKH